MTEFGMIKKGKLMAMIHPKDIQRAEKKTYKIEFIKHEDFEAVVKESFTFKEAKPELSQLVIDIEDTGSINCLLCWHSARLNLLVKSSIHLKSIL